MTSVIILLADAFYIRDGLFFRMDGVELRDKAGTLFGQFTGCIICNYTNFVLQSFTKLSHKKHVFPVS